MIYTSAGRLLAEAARASAVLGTQRGKVQDYLPVLFGDRGNWGRGILAYTRLVESAQADVPLLAESKQQRYRDAVQYASQLSNPLRFQMAAKDFVSQLLTPLVLERLETMDEGLQAIGKSFDVDQGRAADVARELDELIAEIEASEVASIDAFVLARLKELKDALDRYTLYGPEGVEAAVAVMVGTLVMRLPGAMPTVTRNQLLKSIGTIKRVVDTFVYVVGVYESVHIATDALKMLGHSGQ